MSQVSFYPNIPPETLCVIFGHFDSKIIQDGTLLELNTLDPKPTLLTRFWAVNGKFLVNRVEFKVELLFDTGAGACLNLPEKMFNNFIDTIQKVIKVPLHFLPKQYPMFDCPNGEIPKGFPPLHVCFTGSSMCWLFTTSDYVQKSEDKDGKNKCVVKISNVTAQSQTVTLGLPVFKKIFYRLQLQHQ